MASPVTLDQFIVTMFQSIKDRQPRPKSVTFHVALRPLDDKGSMEVVAGQVAVDGAQIYSGDIAGTDAPMKVRFTVPVLA